MSKSISILDQDYILWGHHMLLIDKVKDDYKKAWFYVC